MQQQMMMSGGDPEWLVDKKAKISSKVTNFLFFFFKFYQIYPRSFMDSDNSGEGDIQGVINKLEHLKDLGVTGTWLNPIFKSPMKGMLSIFFFISVIK